MFEEITLYGTARQTTTHRNRRLLALTLVLACLATWAGVIVARRLPAHSPISLVGAGIPQPSQGQAAYLVAGQGGIRASSPATPVPIASVAKVMTAYLVLQHRPLTGTDGGPTLSVTADDVDDTETRRAQDQSIVAVETDEQLTERQALQALLIPSANNIAVLLARFVSGNESDFVAEMNKTARSLGMLHTTYTDPSGFDSQTVSTAGDQVVIIDRAMRDAVFTDIVGTRSVELPVAGRVVNTDTLLGRAGFVGGKTGSDDAAGGCFAFRAIREVNGKSMTITGVVLGQRRGNYIPASMAAAASLVTSVTSSV